MIQVTMTAAIMIMAFIPFSYAQENHEFSIVTNHNFYETGDVIVFSGDVYPVMLDVPVLVQVISDGMIIDVAQITIAQDGSFTHTLIADGKLWKKSGEYFVKASYGTQSAESTFGFTSSTKPDRVTDIFEVDAGTSGTFDIRYHIIGGTLENIIIEPDILGIAIGINSTDSGKLAIELPRRYIDSTDMKGADEIFIILIDGIQVPYVEEPNQNSGMRNISINFEHGDTVIEVIGTRVVPEFGFIATVILAIPIAIIIIIIKSKISCRLFYRVNL